MNTITISFCEEDRKLLEGLMGSVTRLASVLANAQPKDVQKKIIAEAIPEEAPLHEAEISVGLPVEGAAHLEPVTVEAPAEPVYTQAPLYTLDDVRAVVQRLIGPGSTKRKEAKKIVEEYAPKISAIPAEKYPEVLERLAALEKEATNG
jgi:hypothetical protein